jgi:hypothetical protein
MKSKIIHFEQITRAVDMETGEIKQEEKVTQARLPKEPDFVKLYLNTILTFKEVSTKLNPVLLSFLRHMSYAHDNQVIYVNAHMKQEIADENNLKIDRINQALKEFVKANIFRRIGRGTYQVNPHIFGKGEWKDIQRIRAFFDFNSGEVKAIIEKLEDRLVGGDSN